MVLLYVATGALSKLDSIELGQRKLTTKVDVLNTKVDAQEERLGVVESAIRQIQRDVLDIYQRVARVEGKL